MNCVVHDDFESKYLEKKWPNSRRHNENGIQFRICSARYFCTLILLTSKWKWIKYMWYRNEKSSIQNIYISKLYKHIHRRICIRCRRSYNHNIIHIRHIAYAQRWTGRSFDFTLKFDLIPPGHRWFVRTDGNRILIDKFSFSFLSLVAEFRSAHFCRYKKIDFFDVLNVVDKLNSSHLLCHVCYRKNVENYHQIHRRTRKTQ